jgi:hypothetical protein
MKIAIVACTSSSVASMLAAGVVPSAIARFPSQQSFPFTDNAYQERERLPGKHGRELTGRGRVGLGTLFLREAT